MEHIATWNSNRCIDSECMSDGRISRVRSYPSDQDPKRDLANNLGKKKNGLGTRGKQPLDTVWVYTQPFSGFQWCALSLQRDTASRIFSIRSPGKQAQAEHGTCDLT